MLPTWIKKVKLPADIITPKKQNSQQISTSQPWWKPKGWKVVWKVWSCYKIRFPMLMILQHQLC